MLNRDFLECVCVCIIEEGGSQCLYGGMEGNIVGLILSFHLYVNSKDSTQIGRLE